MEKLIQPHGGEVLPRIVEGAKKDTLLKEAAGLKAVTLESLEVSDLIMLASGAFSPLEGFLTQADYDSVVSDMHLSDGNLWPIPVTLAVTKEEAASIALEARIALKDEEGSTLAIMTIKDKYTPNVKKEAELVFKTTDEAHPGVKRLYTRGEVYLGGPVEVLTEGEYPEQYPEYARPADTRAIFAENGWRTIAAFQTRNPLHRSHEYLTKVALESFDGLLIHPIVGKLKPGDIPAETRIKCYRAMLENYYPADRVVLKVYPMEMRYAGPREAVLHAIIRQNFGCTHIIIGRDHAGVGKYYGTFDAQNIFDTLEDGDLLIQPLKFEHVFWCEKCHSIGSIKTCPHGKEDHLFISGTKLREMFGNGEEVPREIARPEIAKILVDYYQNLK